MSTAATRLREAIIALLADLPGYNGPIRRQPVPQIQPSDLPQLSVVITDEVMTPDGDANAGPPRFDAEVSISISDIRGFATQPELDAQQDLAVDAIETALLCNSSFVRGVDTSKALDDPERYPYFEAVTRIQRRRLFPQEGETYFAELRLDIVFMLRVEYDPIIPDDYRRTVLTTRPLGSLVGTPAITTVIDQTTD